MIQKDAKDFDDALSFQVLENGITKLESYCRCFTLFTRRNHFRWWSKRATSVYLVIEWFQCYQKCYPICLFVRPNEEKYTFSKVFQLNNKAEVLDGMVWKNSNVFWSTFCLWRSTRVLSKQNQTLFQLKFH